MLFHNVVTINITMLLYSHHSFTIIRRMLKGDSFSPQSGNCGSNHFKYPITRVSVNVIYIWFLKILYQSTRKVLYLVLSTLNSPHSH